MKFHFIFAISGLLAIAMLAASFSLQTAKEKEQGESFLQFLSYFPKTNLPIEIGLDDMENYAPFKPGFTQLSSTKAAANRAVSPISNSKFIPGAAHSKFSRGGPPALEPVNRFYPNEKLVAVIYRYAYLGGGSPYQTYFMVVYDLKGNILPAGKPQGKRGRQDEQFIIASSADLKTVTCSIDAKGIVWQNTYDNIWKKDVRQEGYQNNQLTDFKIAETKAYQIAATGVAELQNYTSISSRASLD